MILEAQKMASDRRSEKVKRITIAVGELLGFDEMSIRLHWEEFAAGTSLEAAQLDIRFVPAQLLCPKCSTLFPKRGSDLSCPACRVMGAPTATGKEFLIDSLVV